MEGRDNEDLKRLIEDDCQARTCGDWIGIGTELDRDQGYGLCDWAMTCRDWTRIGPGLHKDK